MPRKSSVIVPFSESTASRVAPPPDLKGAARTQFIDLSLACRPDHFDRVDVPLLARYCRALIAEQKAADELERASVIDDKPSAWLQIWVARMRSITTLSRMLRLNPAARSLTPSPSSEPAPPVSWVERQRLLRSRDDQDQSTN